MNDDAVVPVKDDNEVKKPKLHLNITSSSISNDSDDDNDTKDTLSPKEAAGVIRSMKKGNIEVAEISPGIYRATSINSKYIIEYDRNVCIGAASCAAIAPLTFFMDDDNKAMFREDVEDFDNDETILESAQSCPVFAIKILDKETEEILFPAA